jgi:hypothetical protein
MLLGTVPCDFKDFRCMAVGNKHIRMMDALRQAQVINGNNLACDDVILVAGTLLSWPTFTLKRFPTNLAQVILIRQEQFSRRAKSIVNP